MADAVALVRITALLPFTSGLPRDVAENVFHFYLRADTSVIGTIDREAVYDLIQDAFLSFYWEDTAGTQNIGDYMASCIDFRACRLDFATVNYSSSPVTVSPTIATRSIALDTDGEVDSLPNEVALCTSFMGMETPEAIGAGGSTGFPRNRRGRVYIGPLNLTALTNLADPDVYARPKSAFTATVAEASERLVAALTDVAVTDVDASGLVVYSRVRNSLYKIDSGWVDNEFDTQRRRQYAADDRNTWSI